MRVVSFHYLECWLNGGRLENLWSNDRLCDDATNDWLDHLTSLNDRLLDQLLLDDRLGHYKRERKEKRKKGKKGEVSDTALGRFVCVCVSCVLGWFPTHVWSQDWLCDNLRYDHRLGVDGCRNGGLTLLRSGRSGTTE